MKTTILSIAIFSIGLNIFSQDLSNVNKREISISTYNLFGGSYDVNYKSEISKDRFFTLGLINLAGSYNNYKPSTSTSFPGSEFDLSGGIELGLERRKPLSDNIALYYGIDLLTSVYFNNYHKDDPNLPMELRDLNRYTMSAGLRFNFGTIFKIKSNFFFAAELSPSLIYSYSGNELLQADFITRDMNSDIDFNASTKAIKLFLIYQWNRK